MGVAQEPHRVFTNEESDGRKGYTKIRDLRGVFWGASLGILNGRVESVG